MSNSATQKLIAEAITQWPAMLRRQAFIDGAAAKMASEFENLPGAVPISMRQAFDAARGQVDLSRNTLEMMRSMLKQSIRDAIRAGDIPRTEIPRFRQLGIMPQSLDGLSGLGYFSADDLINSYSYVGYGTGGGGGNPPPNGQPAGGGVEGLDGWQLVVAIGVPLALAIASFATVAFYNAYRKWNIEADEAQARIAVQMQVIDEWKRNNAAGGGVLSPPPIVVPRPEEAPFINIGGGSGSSVAAGVGLGVLALAGLAFFFLSNRKGK